jgi:hypothetical protein
MNNRSPIRLRQSAYGRIALWLAAACLGLTAGAPAQQGFINPAPSIQKMLYEFSSSDFVRARIDPRMIIRYFVGEPVVVPIVLSNHTQFPVTVKTNFNPRSHLHVIIRQEGKPSRTYRGPYRMGIYPVKEYFLYPLDEYSENFIVWGDYEEPTGLAFSEPGQYTIEISQEIGVPEGGVSGEINIGTVSLRIDPTPRQFQAFVEALKNDRGAIALQNMKTPPGWEKQMPMFLSQLPVSPLHPYLSLAYADHLQLEWEKAYNDPKKARALADEALASYQVAAKSDSALKLEAYSLLLQYVDRLGLSRVAEQVCREALAAAPGDRRGKMGSSPMLQKYLINTDEIEPTKNWLLFP